MDSPNQTSRKDSLTSSITEGTSKFFSSMMAKKNGIMNDISSLSSKIESTFMPSNVSRSDSDGSVDTDITNVKPPNVSKSGRVKPPRPPPARQESIEAFMSSQREKYGESYKDIPFNPHMSFDSPLYNGPSKKTRDSTAMRSESGDSKSKCPGYSERNHLAKDTKYTRENVGSRQEIKGDISDNSEKVRLERDHVGRNDKTESTEKDFKRNDLVMEKSPGDTVRHEYSNENEYNAVNGSSINQSVKGVSLSLRDKSHPKVCRDINVEKTDVDSTRESEELTTSSHSAVEMQNGCHDDQSEHTGDSSSVSKASSYQTHRRRSSTVDEMLFDDYIEPGPETVPPTEVSDIPAVTKKLIAMGNLISFDDEYGVHHPSVKSQLIAENDRKLQRNVKPVKQKKKSPANDTSDDGILVPEKVRHNLADAADMLSSSVDDSSDVEYGGTQVKRSMSMDSDRSWSSNFSTDSQPDVETRECMTFMKIFIEKIFNRDGDTMTQADKAIFGNLIQDPVGRLWFSRYINSKCDDAEDFSPAKTLMNMCFTFFLESSGPDGLPQKQFLYTLLQQQPIWQSLRFWNAAFFDAVQTERARRPVCTSADGSEARLDDRDFQENITFGQLGTFTCNMRAFGLKRDLCHEFLRKQSVIANLSTEKMKLLKESIEKSVD